MRTLIALALLLLTPGCSGDPATSRLSEGSEAMVRVPELDPKRPSVPGYTAPGGTFMPDDIVDPKVVDTRMVDGSGYIANAGTRVRVIEDKQEPAIRGADKPYRADLDGEVDRRWVKVRFLDGQNADNVGELPRNTLRPIR